MLQVCIVHIFDGQMKNDVRYIGDFPIILVLKPTVFNFFLLLFSIKDEKTQNADKQIKFLSYVLTVADNSFDHLRIMIGEKCCTSRFLAT